MSQAKKQYVVVFWKSWWSEEFAFGPFTSKAKAAKAMAALYRSDFKVPGRYPIWTHAVCPDPTTDHLIGKPCDTCWLIHPEGACDRE